MKSGIRTRELRKIYNSSPPFAAGAGGFVAGTLGRKRQPKPQIVALDGFFLNILPEEIFGLLGPNGAGKPSRCKNQIRQSSEGSLSRRSAFCAGLRL